MTAKLSSFPSTNIADINTAIDLIPVIVDTAGTKSNKNIPVAQYLNRANHTGTIAHSDVSGLGNAATATIAVENPTLPSDNANKLVALKADGKLPAFDGSNLTNLPSGGVALNTANTFTKSQQVATVALTDAATITVDASLSNVFSVTLAGNRTLANPTNLVSGQTILFLIKQDATGSRTLAYGSAYKWSGGTTPTLTTTANKLDVISCVTDGTNLYCNWLGNF